MLPHLLPERSTRIVQFPRFTEIRGDDPGRAFRILRGFNQRSDVVLYIVIDSGRNGQSGPGTPFSPVPHSVLPPYLQYTVFGSTRPLLSRSFLLILHLSNVAQLLDGNTLAQAVRDDVRNDVDAWVADGHRPPCLRVVLIGSNPASEAYVRGKERDAKEAGIDSDTLRYDDDISQRDLLDVVHQLNDDPEVDGLLVQLPLPDHIDDRAVIDAIEPSKDVDGFHPENLGRLLIGNPSFIPATPYGIMEMLRRSDIDVEGMRAVVIGRSNIVGKPLAALLMQRSANATVTVCHSRTRDLAAHTREADLVVAAVGRPAFLTADMVKDGAVVIDVGINRVDDDSREKGYRLVGDVDFDGVEPKASWITPVPGGVGLMTRAMLLKNTMHAARLHAENSLAAETGS